MKTTNNILLGAVTLVMANSAFAYQSPTTPVVLPTWSEWDRANRHPPDPASAYIIPVSGELYLGVDGGAALQQSITLSDDAGDSESVTFDPGPRLDIQMGYNITPNWAAELEVGLVVSPVRNSHTLGTDYQSVELVQLPMMVNAIYSHRAGNYYTWYIGGGVGGVSSYYMNVYSDTTPSAFVFGYQGIAGIRYWVSPRCGLGVGYKLLGTTGYDVGSGITFDGTTATTYRSSGNLTHSILLTFNFQF